MFCQKLLLLIVLIVVMLFLVSYGVPIAAPVAEVMAATAVAPPQPVKPAPLQSNRLDAVWGSSSSDVFAVGERGTILHYNGSAWTAMNSGTVNEIVAVWGDSDSDVFAVGELGMILHYDGAAWSPLNSGTTQDLNGVWGTSGHDVFVVGEGAIILHYDGSAWSVMNEGTTDYDLLSVWGSSDGEIFASGSLGKIWRYNGSDWSPMSTGIAYNHDLWVVWGSSDRDVFTVGYDGMILHYDGSAWSPLDSGTSDELIGVWGSSDHNVFAAGSGGTILHYDGAVWSPLNSGTTNYLTSVWGSSDSDVFAVGDSGTILHYDGKAWSDMSSGVLAAPKYAARGAYAVGTQDFVVEDGDHTVAIAAWYPALNPNHAPEEITYHISDQHPYLAKFAVKGEAIQNAAPDTTHGPYPLVIFSSGQFGWRQYSAYFVEHLASHGFVVMASDPREETMYTFWAGAANRPLDTKLTISFADKATAPGGALDGLIDTKHIAIAGHSSGGWTALVGGGAQFNLDKCAAYFGEDCLEFVTHTQEIAAMLGLKTVPTGLWPPLNDPRVGAIIALAPNGDIWGADYEGAAVVKVPALIMNGTKDMIVPPERAAYPIYQHLGSTQKGLIKFINADHEIFSDSCDTGIPWCARESDAHEHALINHFATAFLLTELKGDQEAAKALLPENVSFPSIEYETTGFSAAQSISSSTSATIPAEAILGGNVQRTGVYDTSGPQQGKLKWKVAIKVTSEWLPAATVANGLVYYGSSDGYLYAVDAQTGQEKWNFKTVDVGTPSVPTVVGGVVYVGSQDHQLYAVDAQTGQEKWRFKTGGWVETSPAVADGVVYFGSDDHYLYALDSQTGQEKWRFEAGDQIWSCPAVATGVVYVGSADHYLYAVNGATGQEKWRFKAADVVYASPALAEGSLYLTSQNGYLYALDSQTGQEKWRFDTKGGGISAAIVDAGLVYVGNANSQLYALDAQTGQEKWQFKTKGTVQTPSIAGDLIYLGSNDGSLYAVDKQSGQQKWQFKATPFQVMGYSPAIADGVAYIVSADGYLYAIQ